MVASERDCLDVNLVICFLWSRYSKLNGEVMIQKGLTKDRTSFRSQNVSGDQHIAEVVCGSGIVWAITDDRIILVRAGVEKGTEEGTSWMPLQGYQCLLLCIVITDALYMHANINTYLYILAQTY